MERWRRQCASQSSWPLPAASDPVRVRVLWIRNKWCINISKKVVLSYIIGRDSVFKEAQENEFLPADLTTSGDVTILGTFATTAQSPFYK